MLRVVKNANVESHEWAPLYYYNKTFMNNKLIKTIGMNYDTHYMNEG